MTPRKQYLIKIKQIIKQNRLEIHFLREGLTDETGRGQPGDHSLHNGIAGHHLLPCVFERIIFPIADQSLIFHDIKMIAFIRGCGGTSPSRYKLNRILIFVLIHVLFCIINHR